MVSIMRTIDFWFAQDTVVKDLEMTTRAVLMLKKSGFALIGSTPAISFLFLSVWYQRMSDLSSVWIVKP